MGDETLIQRAIRKLGSQAALAAACGVSAQHVKEIKLGRRDMGAPLRQSIDAVLDGADNA